jgi:hypothetical protein
VWKHNISHPPGTFGMAPSQKVMLILFTDSKGTIFQCWLPQNGVYYANTFKTIKGMLYQNKKIA